MRGVVAVRCSALTPAARFGRTNRTVLPFGILRCIMGRHGIVILGISLLVGLSLTPCKFPRSPLISTALLRLVWYESTVL